MEPSVQDPVVVVADLNGNPEQACQALFYGDYHYCGEAGIGQVLCCIGDFA